MINYKNLFGSLLFGGTVIGAGVLGLPFALAQGGFFSGAILLFLGGFFAYMTSAYIAILAYQQDKILPVQLILKKYLGKNIGILSLASVMFISYGALIAYPLAAGEIFSTLFGWPFWLGALGFIVVMTALVSRRLGQSNKINSAVAITLTVLLLWIIIRSIPSVENQNLMFFSPGGIFDAWGVVVFAFAAQMVIPNVIYYINAPLKDALKVIKGGLIGVGVLYFAFFFVAIGAMGENVTSVATLGLGAEVGREVIVVGQIFAILALMTSFFGIAHSLRLTYERQFKCSRLVSLMLIVIPVVIFDYFLSAGGGEAFVRVLDYAGGIGSALYAGIIPAIIVLLFKDNIKFPFGVIGAYLTIIFYGLTLIYTLFF
ncbi:hypothetical protein SYNTR_1504 [Candidatus Syntrophocurvum alkaliphilum]|uniref:Tyrosine-specific transport protein n=1 Tax=Candidatus Syntrophocurvum alkaliphilum TaxID=2293317 RepID=A0A6I6DGH2_9FIRM|nr:aromatic amino acid transport family protein [Candidatus Syntrophocurvum alkaliphilum]QGU00098.1 hypothetical protein SYNTR_1504 [Candidatus Syntrophocurvum alkaliphilum]